MNRKRILAAVCGLFLTCTALSGCSAQAEGAFQDGYYTAEMSEFSHGWKEYVTISVSGGKITTAEFNAYNASGFIKAWDIAYMRSMMEQQGTYPNRYTRAYAAELVGNQGGAVDAVSGATNSGDNFQQLTAALFEKARAGDTSLAIVQASE